MALSDMLQQSRTGLLHQIQHLFKALGLAVVGVGNLPGTARQQGIGPFSARVEVQQQAKLCPAVGGLHGLQMFEITTIHRQHMVKAMKVLRLNLAGAQGAEVIAPLPGRRHGARIGRLANMPVTSTGGIHLDVLAQPRFLQLVAKDAIGGGRATDVAQTDKQHGYHVSFFSSSAASRARTRARSAGVSTPGGMGTQAGATWMLAPCSSTRSCSSFSVCSRLPRGQRTKSLSRLTR